MDDFRVYVDLPDHPKTRALARRLGSLPAAIGVVVTLWAHARKVAPSGELHGATAADLAVWCRWDGDPDALALALVASCPGHLRGFLTSLPGGGFRLNGWSERQPRAAHAHATDVLNDRPANARRAAAQKAGRASAARRAALGWIRDARGRLHPPGWSPDGPPGHRTSPNGTPNGAPNDLRTTATERPPNAGPTQPLGTPNAAPNASERRTERSSPLHKNPPSPRSDADPGRAASRSPDPDQIGPKPPPVGAFAQRHAEENLAALERLRVTAALGALSPRNEEALRHLERWLTARKIPFDPVTPADLPDASDLPIVPLNPPGAHAHEA